MERARRRARGPARGAARAARPGSHRRRARSTRLGPRDHYEQAVAAGGRAHRRRGAGEGRAGPRGHGRARPPPTTPAPIFGALRELFPSCFCFCVGTPEAAFIGASPELLIRRRGAVAATVALAGSTRRSADPAVDDHLGEQMLHSAKVREEHEIVARRIERALRPHSVWVAGRGGARGRAGREHPAPRDADPAPSSPTRARRSSWPGLLHPTPAVGGEPREAAVRPDRASSRASTAAGTPARSAGWTPPRTASSASRCAPACCATAPRTSTPAAASSPARTPPPSWPRPRSSSRRCCRCCAG